MLKRSEISKAIKILSSGGVGILPTDTIYGIVGSALMPETVARIYRLRKRNPEKPMIVLISSASDIEQFGVATGGAVEDIISRIWPGKVSVILPISPSSGSELKKFNYLHRKTGALAFRVPKPAWLRRLLEETGPLVAPSANFEGEPPALTIHAAKRYFGKNADFYADAGRIVSKPSTLITIEKGKMMILREGAMKISQDFVSAHFAE